MRKTRVWFCLKCGVCGIHYYFDEHAIFDIVGEIRNIHAWESKHRGKHKIECTYDPRILNQALCAVQEIEEL